MTESYDVAQQPKRMGMGLPIGLAAAGAAGGYFLQPKSGMSAEELAKLFESNDTVEIKNKLKNSSEEAIKEAKKLQQDLKEAEAKFAEAQKAKLPETANEAKALKAAKERMANKIKELQAIENASGGVSVENKFPKASDFIAARGTKPITDLYNGTEQRELDKLVTTLQAKETAFLSGTAQESNRLNGLLDIAQNGTRSGSIPTIYDGALQNITVYRPDTHGNFVSTNVAFKDLTDIELDRFVEEKLSNFYDLNSAQADAKNPLAQRFIDTATTYHNGAHNVQGMDYRMLKFKDAQNVGDTLRVETSVLKPKQIGGYASWRKNDKGEWFTYSLDQGQAYVQKAKVDHNDAIMGNAKDMFGKMPEYARLKHRAENLRGELGNITSGGVIDLETARASGLMNTQDLTVDINALMNKEADIMAANTSVFNRREKFDSAIEYVTKMKGEHPDWKPNRLNGQMLPLGFNRTGQNSLDDVLVALENGKEAVSVNPLQARNLGLTGTTEEQLAQLEARVKMVDAVKGEEKNIGKEIEQLFKDTPLYQDAKEMFEQKAAEFPEYAEAKRAIVEKYGNLKIGNSGKTLAQLMEGGTSTGKIITEADVPEEVRKALADAEKIYKEAASKSGVVDEGARKIAEENRNAIKTKFQTALEKIGGDSKVGKWFGGKKWVAAAIGGVVLFLVGLGIRNSKNKEA